MNKDILNTSNLYAEGLKHVEERRAQWLEKHKELKAHLKEIADYLTANSAYKQGFFVDTLHAFNEEINGTCAQLPSVNFRTGNMPMQIAFHNPSGEMRDYTEYGFRLTFTPTISGEIVILLYPHYSDLNKNQQQYVTLGVITDLSQLTMETVDDILNKAMQAAYYSSFTGVAEMPQQEQAPQMPAPPRHNPIGFKRYETTEKVL